jgi:hypothetical protein
MTLPVRFGSAILAVLSVHLLAAAVIDTFETPALPSGGSTPVINWTPDAGTVANIFHPVLGEFNAIDPLAPPAGGDQALVIVGANKNIERNVGVIQPGMIYTLTVAIGNRIPDGGLHAWDIQLWAGTTTRGSFIDQIFLDRPGADNPAAGSWADNSVAFRSDDFPALVGSNLYVLLGTYLGSSLGSAYFDNVRVDATAAVPEPGSLALVLVGGGGLVFVRRKSLLKTH